jgi:hypothetical protein
MLPNYGIEFYKPDMGRGQSTVRRDSVHGRLSPDRILSVNDEGDNQPYGSRPSHRFEQS